MSQAITLLAGLGNPGRQYSRNRHNAGALLLEELCRRSGGQLREEKKFQGLYGSVSVAGHELKLLFPSTFMNNSGRAVAAVANFYKIPPEQILVAYDELDLPLGTTRLKNGGGHGGHNGIRDIIAALGSRDFVRLRLGIGHPGSADRVTGHVLSDFTASESVALEQEIDKALAVLPLVLEGRLETAMQQLHTKTEP